MLRFLGVRLLGAIPTLVIVAVTVFFLIRLIPGDPAVVMLGDGADLAAVEMLREQMGLDHSLPVQFGYWLSDILRGDFGQSLFKHQPVGTLVLERFVVSARIVLVAVIAAALVAIPCGMLAAWKQNTWMDTGVVAVSTLLLSIPTFWLGLLLLILFGIKLGWLPIVGYVGFATDPWRALQYMALPILTLFIHEIGTVTRMMRASMLEVLRLDYITHARSKGLSEWDVLRHHAFRNAMGPTWTMLGLTMGNLLGGIAVIETVFTIPGLGRLLVESIYARDYPVVQGCLLFVAATYVVVNLIVDMVYPVFDPKVTM